ncbi:MULTISPECIES: hypothetical protein [Dickeya]|uniref:Origin specific replication initiation factor \|nr:MULTISPECIES: hypothetical protein [Dickeya]SLM63519.1 Origin specific replication initiation factor \
MSRIFNIVSELTGQRNSIVIPRPLLRFFSLKGEQQAAQLAMVLGQLIYWSGKSKLADGWFYKEHAKLGEELELSARQVQRIVEKLELHMPGVLTTGTHQLPSGKTVKHYHLDGEALIGLIFPEQKTIDKPDENPPTLPVGNSEDGNPGIPKMELGDSEVGIPYLYAVNYIQRDDLTIISKYSSQRFSQANEATKAKADKFISHHPDAVIFTPAGKAWGTFEDVKAAVWMYEKILTLDASAKTPNWPEWANTIRLMRQQDGLTHREICEAFRWANTHEFWQSNILSPAKLRVKWGALKIQRTNQIGKQHREELDWDSTDWADGLGGLI